MESWEIQPTYTEDFGRRFRTLDALLAADSERVGRNRSGGHMVHKIQGTDTAYFVKVYLGCKSLKTRLIGNDAEREFNNLLYMKSLGVPVPAVVAFGERSCADGVQQSLLVTEQVENSVDLAFLADSHHPLLGNKKWFDTLITRLAQAVGRIHRDGFTHNDLNWRNVLVVLNEEPQVYLCDCPKGRRWFSPLLQFRIAKDLTHLDKYGRKYLTRTQRLRFYKAYCGERRVSPASKLLLRKVLSRQVDEKYRPVYHTDLKASTPISDTPAARPTDNEAKTNTASASVLS